MEVGRRRRVGGGAAFASSSGRCDQLGKYLSADTTGSSVTALGTGSDLSCGLSTSMQMVPS